MFEFLLERHLHVNNLQRKSAMLVVHQAVAWVALLGIILYPKTAQAIQCYQCDSNEDLSCPSYESFDKEVNAPVNCNSFEANTPGQFCMKITQESPGWRGWKKITRRCGSRTDQGVAWGCRWSWDTVGVFKEICYCETNNCNGASSTKMSFASVAIVFMGFLLRRFL